jgi:hypothetical protein
LSLPRARVRRFDQVRELVAHHSLTIRSGGNVGFGRRGRVLLSRGSDAPQPMHLLSAGRARKPRQ